MSNTGKKGATVKDVPAEVFITELAAHLKKKLELPDWHDLVKTASYKELCPRDEDWYFVRAASLARKIYIRQGTGVGALTKVYGGRNRRGTRREHFAKGSSGIIRHLLQELAKIEYVQTKEGRKGRFITQNGQRELDTIAGQALAKLQAEK